MPNTTTNVPVPPKTWVNVYSAAGITVGVQVVFQALRCGKDFPLLMCVSAAAPTGQSFNVYNQGEWGINDSGDSGLWAYCDVPASINVRVA